MKRIQRQRTKGWRMPEGAVYVGRPTRWGSPFHVPGVAAGRQDGTVYVLGWDRPIRSRADSVAAFRSYAVGLSRSRHFERWIAPLRGHDLACWCPLDQPCHADVLIELCRLSESSAAENVPDMAGVPGCAGATAPCIFPGCVSTDRHWHGGFPGGYTNPDDPEGAPIPFTREPDPGVRDYNGALLPSQSTGARPPQLAGSAGLRLGIAAESGRRDDVPPSSEYAARTTSSAGGRT